MPLASPRHHVLTLADYFVVDRASSHKHEYHDGQIFLMAGGTPRHNYVAQRILEALGRQLGAGPCFTMPADQRVSTHDGLYTYADGCVFCGSVEVGLEQTATNPVVVVQVLSDATRTYDRGEKLERYKTIPSLRHVVLAESDGPDVEVWTRSPDGLWARVVRVDLADRVRMEGIDAELILAELYHGIDRLPA